MTFPAPQGWRYGVRSRSPGCTKKIKKSWEWEAKLGMALGFLLLGGRNSRSCRLTAARKAFSVEPRPSPRFDKVVRRSQIPCATPIQMIGVQLRTNPDEKLEAFRGVNLRELPRCLLDPCRITNCGSLASQHAVKRYGVDNVGIGSTSRTRCRASAPLKT